MDQMIGVPAKLHAVYVVEQNGELGVLIEAALPVSGQTAFTRLVLDYKDADELVKSVRQGLSEIRKELAQRN